MLDYCAEGSGQLLISMKNINPIGLFDDNFLMEKLTKLGDPLQKLNDYIDWKIFNETLDAAGVFANEGKMVDVRQADGSTTPTRYQ